jgi:hypothetical protein
MELCDDVNGECFDDQITMNTPVLIEESVDYATAYGSVCDMQKPIKSRGKRVVQAPVIRPQKNPVTWSLSPANELMTKLQNFGDFVRSIHYLLFDLLKFFVKLIMVYYGILWYVYLVVEGKMYSTKKPNGINASKDALLLHSMNEIRCLRSQSILGNVIRHLMLQHYNSQ